MASRIGISFNVRFFALNLLISAFHKNWKCTPNDTQRSILGFLDDSLRNPIPVCFCFFLFNVGDVCRESAATQEVCSLDRDGNDGLLAKSMEELHGIIGELCGVVFLE